MIQYQCGCPESPVAWRGYVDYDEEQQVYRLVKGAQESCWIKLAPLGLKELIDSRWWVPVRPELQLPEGF